MQRLTKMSIGWMLVMLVLGMLGCGSGDDGGVGYAAVCEGVCERKVRCDGVTQQDCEASCRTTPAIYQADLMEAYEQCMRDLACTDSDDVCEAEVYALVPNAEMLITSCLDQYEASCPNYSDIDESICLALPWLTEDVQSQLMSCFSGSSCGEDCAQTVLAGE